MKNSDSISFLTLIFKRYTIALVFILVANTVLAQTPGKVTVVKDARIDTLIALRLALSKTTSSAVATVSTATTGNGYRVQFFMSTNRNEVYTAQSKFNGLFPDLKTYIVYIEPNFKIRAGDFRTRLEASRLLEQLRSQFPSLFIIPEKINLKND